MNPPLNAQERERLLTELARRDAGQLGEPLSDDDESTLAGMKAEFDTLAADLVEPPPIDEFAEESDCQRAVELVERIGRGPEFSETGSSQFFPHPLEEEPIPAAIGPYRVVARLGRGGMGAVYKALHPKLKREVAVKVLPSWRMGDPASIARFEREMEVVGALDHPNIVVAHDAGEADGMHYLVMEYVDGLDLSSVVRRLGPLPVAEACEIVIQAAQGLAAAADRGMVHRDIKPSNLMLAEASPGRDGAIVKILDFGLARLALPFDTGADRGELTGSGMVMGTLRYMAPEQCVLSSAVDVRADIYSLGGTLYKLLCGASPFAEERFDSPLALLAALAREEPPRLADQRPDAPPHLAAVVERMMAKSPAARFSSPQQVVEALAPWRRGADLAGLLDRARRADGDASDIATPRRSRTPAPFASAVSEPPRDRRKLARTMAWIGLALAGATAALVFILPRTPTPKPRAIEAARALIELPQLPLGDSSYALSRSTADWLAARNANFGVSYVREGIVYSAAGADRPPGPIQLDLVDLKSDAHLRDADLARLHDLPFLELLNLSFTNIGDEGLNQLGELPMLEHLFLVETAVTDAGAGVLGRFPRLTTLYLQNTTISDAGLKSVGRLPQLGELMLIGCNVTDAGLAHLHGLSELRTLYLEGTNVSARGVAELQSALPNCSIYSDIPSDEIARARHDAGGLAD